MCFSATASLTAGTILLGIGVVTTRMARSGGERAYAAIPLLFAIQQLTEGVVWLSFGWGIDAVTAAATQLYSFFSHVLWPVYVPIAAWLIEPDRNRRRMLAVVCLAGLGVGAYLLYAMFAFPIVARPVGGHIDYASPHFYVAISMTLYLTATTVSLILSSHAWVRLFGLLALGSAVAAYAFYGRWFISVWCFFAAAMSVVIALHLLAARRATPSPGGECKMTARRQGADLLRPLGDVPFFLLLVAGLAVSMSYGVTLPVLPELVLRVQGGGPDGAARHTGWLTGAFTVALFAFSPVWGAVSDFLDRRWVIAAGLAGSAIALLLLGMADSLAGVYAARIAAGLVAAAVMPAVLAYVAETTAPARRQRHFAWVASATALGFLLGPVAGSAAAALGNRVSGLQLVALVCLLAAVLGARLPRGQDARSSIATAPDMTTSSLSLGRMRQALLLTAAVVFGITVAEVGLTLQGGPVAPYFALCSTLMVAMQLAGYPVLERWIGEHRLVWTSLAVMAVGVALLSWRAPWSPAVAFLLAASALGVLIPALAVRISSAAGPRQGRAMGRQAAAGNLGQAGGAALTGVLFSTLAAAPFLLAGALLAIGSVMAWARPEGSSQSGGLHGGSDRGS